METPIKANKARPRRRLLLVRSACVSAVATALLLGVACGKAPQQPDWVVECNDYGPFCICLATSPPMMPTSSCNPTAFPGTTCCADGAWPTGGSCSCEGTTVLCGIVPKFFGELPGCVCAPGGLSNPSSANQVAGATCEPGSWESPAGAFGACCFYPADDPAGDGAAVCACGPSSGCETGSMKVASCSASSFPPPAAPGCSDGTHQVQSCFDSDAGVTAGDTGATGPGDTGTAVDSSRPTPEAGVCGASTAGACNQLPNIGTVITSACVAGAPPAMTGGAIADGTYVLVSATAYTSSCSGIQLPTGGPTTLLLSAGCEQSIDIMGGAKTYTFATSGSTLTENEVCPGSGSYPLPYTATATTLSELAPFTPGVNIVSVFRKQ